MVTVDHASLTPGQCAARDRLASELAIFLASRDLEDAVRILRVINAGLELELESAPVEAVTVH